jgi:RNA polymerase sigma factor (sigma-70 family)
VSVSLSHVDGPGDAELIAAVRGGDLDAYGELYARHVDAARRLGRQLTNPADADDLVSDAFTKVLTVLQRGGGPDLAFRAYLLTAVRRLHVDRLRAGSRLRSVDDLTPFDPGLPFHDTAVEGFDNAAAAKAFASLPERWQMVLWHTEVEGQKPADIAPMLGMSANSVAALAYRAREGLRQAFLSQHAADRDDVDCAWTRDHLGAYVRGGLSRRDAGKVDDHLADCRACAAVYLELTEVNSGLAGLLAPLLLGVAGTGYLSSAHGGAAAAATGGVVSSGLSGVKGWVTSHAPLTAVGGVAVTATALLAVYGVSHFNGHEAADAGGPQLQIPGASTGSQAPGPSRAVQPHRAGQTPRVVLGNPGPTSQPGTAPTATLPVAPASQASPGTTGPTGQPTGNPGGNPHGNPSSQPTQPTSPPTTKPPVGDVTFTSTPPPHPAVGGSYPLTASGGSGKFTFAIGSATRNAACSMQGAATVSFDHPGTCQVVASDSSAGKLRATVAEQTFSVDFGDQAIDFSFTPTSLDFGTKYPLSATGGKSGSPVVFTLDQENTTNSACSVSDSFVVFQHHGVCAVDADQAGSSDYHAAETVTQRVDVPKMTQSISFTPDRTSFEVGDSLSASASSGATVQLHTDNPDVCAVSDTNATVTFLIPGSCAVTADQSGNADFQPAPTASVNVKVVASPEDIDLGVIGEKGEPSNGQSTAVATLTGQLPVGATATLTATADGTEDFRPTTRGYADFCRRQDADTKATVWICTLTPERLSLTFTVNTQQGRDVTFEVQPDAPYRDSKQGNNVTDPPLHWVKGSRTG